MSVAVENSEATILARVVNAENANLSQDAATSILQISFPASDLDRMNLLAEKARQGTLSVPEATELESYEHVGQMLELFQLKARLSLKNARGAA
jgi:hypothetical protein